MNGKITVGELIDALEKLPKEEVAILSVSFDDCKPIVGRLVSFDDGSLSERFFYGIGAYGYEDYEEHILFHTQKFSYDEFLEIVKEAQKKSKKYHSYSYSQNVLNCLCEEFGFKKLGYPLVDIGCSRKSEVTLERFDDG